MAIAAVQSVEEFIAKTVKKACVTQAPYVGIYHTPAMWQMATNRSANVMYDNILLEFERMSSHKQLVINIKMAPSIERTPVTVVRYSVSENRIQSALHGVVVLSVVVVVENTDTGVLFMYILEAIDYQSIILFY